MSVITVLPVSLRNKIAAGEVVERPASVVKELIENAIDAESTRISVETVRAGKKLIHVSDNGTGMDREDAVRAFERYATSKIKNEQDLFSLKTMGFRGEALSSIAAVSKMTLMTAVRNVEFGPVAGTCVEIAGGEIVSVKDCAAAGTSIEVKELFFNTPARRKFLKSDATENYHIIDTVTREALSHPHLMFALRMDGSEVFSLPAASSLRERLIQLYGRDFIDGLIECGLSHALDTGMTVSVFTSGLAHMKNNRNTQFIFVNRRPVKDPAVAYAVCKAYEGMAPKEKHPAFFIFLDIDAGQVDFNVHPAKREVRFAQKTGIFDFVCHAVTEGLKKDAGFCFSDVVSEKTGTHPSFETKLGCVPVFSPFFSESLISEQTDTFFTGPAPLLYLGETFVAVAAGGGLVLLDYHAAHERVNYERFLKRRDLQAHRLLFPLQVKLRRGEYAVILEHLSLLNEVGLEAEDFGHDTILIRSIPEVLRDADLASLVTDVAAALLEIPGKSSSKNISGSPAPVGESGPVELIRRSIAARLACHSSIRGKEIPDGIRVAELLKSLDATDNPHSCPHGRPTRIVISPDELRKMFKK